MVTDADPLARKLAAILHADIVDSTRLVQQDETLAHKNMQRTFREFAGIIASYHGTAREIRGDALVAEFPRASDAVCAALVFQQQSADKLSQDEGDLQPRIRVGISLGEVIIADETVTGPGVVLAQRLEQLADPGGVVVQGSLAETVPARLPFEFESMGEQELKGFDRPVRAFSARLVSGEVIPDPYPASSVAEVAQGHGNPSIAVLPLDNLSGDPEQTYFSEGITEDIITELSRFRSLSVVARNSSFAFSDKNLSAPEIAEKLGVDYIVEGSVRRAGNRVRITAQLIEAESGTHVWAQRYDRDLQDIFAVQDEVTQMIVATVGGRLEDHRIRIADRSGANAWSVYDLVLQAQANHYRILKSSNSKARELLEQSLEIDSDNARSHSLMGAVELLDYASSWTATPETTLERALYHGRKAIQLDNTDSLAHARLGETLIHFDNIEESRAHCERALDLNPNDSASRALFAIHLTAVGEAEQALEQLETVRKIDPYERVWTPWLRGEALFFVGKYREAIASFEEVTEPINSMRALMAGSYAMTGQKEKGIRLLNEFIDVSRQEMPLFPGNDLENWSAYWHQSSDTSNEENFSQLMNAIRDIWPD